MHINTNFSEILRLSTHIKTESDIDDEFHVCDHGDIKIIIIYNSGNESIFLFKSYSVLFKTKNVDIIKHYMATQVDCLSEYEEICFDNVDQKFSFYSKDKIIKKLTDPDFLEQYICKIFFYLYDNQI